MPRKSSAIFLQKVSNLLKISIFLAKFKKPIIPKLVLFLKKGRKLKKFKTLKQYNRHYDYVKEYEFSPSSTPLIEFRRKSRDGRISFKKLYSNVLLISKCLGMDSGEIYCLEMAMDPSPLPCFESAAGRELMMIDSSNSWSEDESVDERAERFIQRFYEDMRRQRRESNFHLLET